MVEEHQQRDASPVVVTTGAGGRKAAGLVGFHTRESAEPEVHAVWLARSHRTTAVAARADHLAVHYLHGQPDDVAEVHTTEWDPGPFGLPLLRAWPDRVVLERVELIDVPEADHVCWLGRVADRG